MKRFKEIFRSCLNPKFLVIAGAVLIAVFIFFPPLRSLAIGYGLLLLLCPLGMFFAMRLMMNTGSQQGMGHEEISAANGAAAPHTAKRMNPAAQPAETPYLLKKKGEESL